MPSDTVPVIPNVPSEIKEEQKSPESIPAQEEQSFIDNGRSQMEEALVKQNEAHLELPLDDSQAESKKEQAPEANPVERIKERVQKRIDKEVAKRKTLEDENAELKSELERLKKQAAPQEKVDEKREPTDLEIRAALKKAREEGDVEFEAQILEYMTERKANKIADERIKQLTSKDEEARKSQEKLQNDWVSLNRDYTWHDDQGNPDYNHELSLSNQTGLLYRTAMALYQDQSLKGYYGDPDKIMGFRRAVADAEREIHRQGLYKPQNLKIPQASQKPREVFADPNTTIADEEAQSQNSPTLDPADILKQEIKNRRAYQDKRGFSIG